MKCPKCWAEKAYVRKVKGFQGFLLSCALLVPMKCLHCYHKFVVSWFFAIGEQINPPKPPTLPTSRTGRSAHAKKHRRHSHADRHRHRYRRAGAA